MNPSELIEQLPPDLQKEVMDFAKFLLESRSVEKADLMQELHALDPEVPPEGIEEPSNTMKSKYNLLVGINEENLNEASMVLKLLM